MARTITQYTSDKNNRFIFYGAIGLALLAAVLVFAALSNFGGSSGSNSSVEGLGPTVDVVVASQDISAGTKVTADMLEIATLPSKGIITGALLDKTAAVGLVSRYPMAKGEQFSADKLGQGSSDKTFSDVVPDGKRAVSVDVDEKTSVGGLIVAGDHVDVIVIGKTKSPDQTIDGLPASFTLLQDVEVLSVAQEAQKAVARFDSKGNPIQTDNAAGEIASRPSDTSADPKAKSVTLAVSPDEAARLALASQSYSIYLSLRGTGDNSTIDNPSELQQLPKDLQ
jgi:pilus assembly protein CpaB